MALTEREKADLIDNQFAYDGDAAGAVYVRHLPCDTAIYLGEPEDVQNALAHLPDCPNPDGPANTYRGNRPWRKGTDAQEAKKEAWLKTIEDHPETTDQDYDTAVSILVDVPVDQLSLGHLEKLGFVIVQSEGSIVAKDW
jgi:hypothetical protein